MASCGVPKGDGHTAVCIAAPNTQCLTNQLFERRRTDDRLQIAQSLAVSPPIPGVLYVVATPLGHLEDITLRALAVLRAVALVACEDTRHTGNLLRAHGIDTRTTSYFEHNERWKGERILAELRAGRDVALVSDAGTPGISDPGFRLVRDARAEGIAVEPVPGPSAAVAALSVSEIGRAA